MADPFPSLDRFTDAYAGGDPSELPWYSAEPDADLMGWFGKLLQVNSDVVDLGAGPCVHGLWLGARGHRVTAIDAVKDARDMAMTLAERAGVSLTYHVADALDWKPSAGLGWDLVLDRGFLHGLRPPQRPLWLERVRGLLRPGGHLLVKSFTCVERGFGPPGLGARDLLAAIDEGQPAGLDLIALERSSFNLSEARDDLGEHSAWTLVARKVS
jgi:SAM-dependent methyltransferase